MAPTRAQCATGYRMAFSCNAPSTAATNRLDMLTPELRSRFAIRWLNPYSRDEYLTVVSGVLVRRENTSQDLAEEITKRLDGRSHRMSRDSKRAARLALPLLPVM